MLYDYFTKGTEGTVTGTKIGMEIETDFFMKPADFELYLQDARLERMLARANRNPLSGVPIPEEVTSVILAATKGRPKICQQKLELGRQKIELSIDPQPTFGLLWEAASESLHWLYGLADSLGAYPFFGPEFLSGGDLLFVQEERDEIWVQLDGRVALEHLCRCSSVQFMIDVNSNDAIAIINRAWEARLQLHDYTPNDARQRAYNVQSKANYRPDRYGGPVGFDDLRDYVHELERHDVVMHRGRPVRLNPTEVPDLNVDLFLRSVWWHYRLRRFGSTLALEMRPFSRRRDEDIPRLWSLVAQTIGL